MKCKVEGCSNEFISNSRGLRKKPAGPCNRHRWLKHRLGYFPNLAEYDEEKRQKASASKLSQGLEVGQFVDSNGYVRYTQNNKYVHRILMEAEIGRALLTEESIHHKDGNKLNNDLGNLELWSTSQPAGQRVSDKLAWAKEIISLYS